MEDDSGYVYEDESVEEQGSGSNRPFLIAVGILMLIFVLANICSGAVYMNRRGGGNTVEIAQATSIAATNEAILAQNAQVTQTIAAMQTEEARPTDTPTPPPPTFTAEPSPTNTPRPTKTPVIANVEDEEVATGEGGAGTAGEEGDMDSLENVSGTSIFENNTENSTPTPIPVSGGSDNNALPDTGFELWAVALTGIVLIGVLVAARRMRGA
ncbi:MAG: hypothetical protein CSA11_11090 [Chloroflexi bacterium]|nr:MAG: hypothetical protein CSA11_11090 [Chloroflexota bacterium]